MAKTFAEVFARSGDQPRRSEMLALAEDPRFPNDRNDDIRATVALVTGDTDSVIELLDRAEKLRHTGHILVGAIPAYMNSGQTDIEPFLARLPPRYLPDVRMVSGRKRRRWQRIGNLSPPAYPRPEF